MRIVMFLKKHFGQTKILDVVNRKVNVVIRIGHFLKFIEKDY